ncbi:MAG: hypothetical protein ACRDG4_08430 [Chloroflexota bacterium]
MSRRSPFWQPFSARTPLGYSVAGYFSTEPGSAYGTIRFTHVDGPLKRPYSSPPVPAPSAPESLATLLEAASGAGSSDVRALERPDGTTVAFYPLYDADGGLVEVVPRTRDTVVIADTPWRPLAALVRAARHAGMEEAVRRLRAILVFTLEGSDNARIARVSFPHRLTLTAALPGTGRARASYGQLQAWADQYGLDLPATRHQFSGAPNSAEVRTALARPAGVLPAPGAWSGTGLLLAISSRGGSELVDLPADWPAIGSESVGLIALWDAMARVADRGEVPTWDRMAALLPVKSGDEGSRSTLSAPTQAWQRWAVAYPEAFGAADQIAV